MTEQTKETIKAVLRCDATATHEEQARIIAALSPAPVEASAELPPVYSWAEAMRVTGLSRSALVRRVGTGDLRPVYFGANRANGLTRASVDALLASPKAAAPRFRKPSRNFKAWPRPEANRRNRGQLPTWRWQRHARKARTVSRAMPKMTFNFEVRYGEKN